MVSAVTMSATRRFYRLSAPLAAGLLLAACLSQAALETPDPAPLAVIPAPATVERLDGSFSVAADTPVWQDGSPESRRIAGYFADLVRRTRQWTLPVQDQRDA